ncbi:MAG: prepilin-type N-terminal cleavage/methylation domain-containing protein, partial [Candidatus Omnitrophica bacterium]|nr:prepilin-type N-terminal cleavage/methylation domain-containing protein [Candidatus Omnitrophota bacterium]
MMHKFLRNGGVTLLEMMIGAIIIALISLAGWVSVSVMSRSGEMSRNLVSGVNLLQLSQEEVRRIAQVEAIFDNLENCDFPPDNSPKEACGLKDVSADWPGFDRALQVVSE